MSGVTNIRAALETALSAMTPALSTAWENAPFTPIVGTAYQKVHLLFAEPLNQEYGNRHQEIGYMQVTLMYPLLTGAAATSARAELIREAFKRGNTFTSSGVTVMIAGTPEVSPGMIDGDRFAVPVKIKFHANIG